jgi:hypothetical protein
MLKVTSEQMNGGTGVISFDHGEYVFVTCYDPSGLTAGWDAGDMNSKIFKVSDCVDYFQSECSKRRFHRESDMTWRGQQWKREREFKF